MNPGRWIRVTDPRLGEALPWRNATAIRPRSAPAAAAAEHRGALIPTFDWPYGCPAPRRRGGHLVRAGLFRARRAGWARRS